LLVTLIDGGWAQKNARALRQIVRDRAGLVRE